MADDEYLTRKAASAFLEKLGCFVAPQTLANMAKRQNAGRGPAFTRTLSRIVRYRKSDLASWAAQKTVRVE